jgi:hypothetical protein
VTDADRRRLPHLHTLFCLIFGSLPEDLPVDTQNLEIENGTFHRALLTLKDN